MIVRFFRAVNGLLICLLLTACALPSMSKMTPGAYLKDISGPVFQEMNLTDGRNSLIYFYRPISPWAEEELEAPTIFVNGEPLVTLKSGQYTWLEYHAGQVNVKIKRSLLGIFFRTVSEVNMNISGGTSYFVRYQEALPNKGDKREFRDLPLQLVSREIGLSEVELLRLDQPGRYHQCEKPGKRWATFLPVNTPKFKAKCEFKAPEIQSVQPRK